MLAQAARIANETQTLPAEIAVGGVRFVADPAGALFDPDQRVLLVSDLHLEKGSSFAARGMLLPPFDTAATLLRLAALLAHYAPRLVIALGDSFHDRDGPFRLAETDRAALAALQAGRDWLWILGNHDPHVPPSCGGETKTRYDYRGLTLRHEPSGASHEIAGHLHPSARIATRARIVTRRCFIGDGERLIMPAFGAYTGGLNICGEAFAGMIALSSATAHVLGDGRIHAIPAHRCAR